MGYYASKLEKTFHQKKKRPGNHWRLDETYIKVKRGNMIDFLLTTKRDTKAAINRLNQKIINETKLANANILTMLQSSWCGNPIIVMESE
jgi:putative transposase